MNTSAPSASSKRCPRCERPQSHCYCAQLTPLGNRWPIWICQHPRESRHALGTARIAALGLENARMVSVTDTVDASLFPSVPAAPALIYPGRDALPVDALADEPVRPLLFLDATWRKSHRMLMESPWLQSLPRYGLINPGPGRYRIRRAPKPDALSTLEAIVLTLEAVERNGPRYQPLLKVMDGLIEEQIRHMGEEVFSRNYPLRES